MSRKTGLILAILALLVWVLWMMHSDPATSTGEQLVIEPVAELERIEIMPPDAEDAPELIALERDLDGRWVMVRPLEEALTDDAGGFFEAVFREPIVTDDLVVDAERAPAYDLDDDRAVLIALFGAGDHRPTRELLVGTEIEVPQTGARRTFIKKPGGDSIYRARIPLGHLVRLDVETLVGDRDQTEAVEIDDPEPINGDEQ